MPNRRDSTLEEEPLPAAAPQDTPLSATAPRRHHMDHTGGISHACGPSRRGPTSASSSAVKHHLAHRHLDDRVIATRLAFVYRLTGSAWAARAVVGLQWARIPPSCLPRPICESLGGPLETSATVLVWTQVFAALQSLALARPHEHTNNITVADHSGPQACCRALSRNSTCRAASL